MKELKKVQYSCSFACLDCRKVFKRPVTFPYSDADDTKRCPHCGNISYNCGRKFHAPKMRDDKAWEIIEFLIRKGFVFHKIREPLPSANHDPTSRFISYTLVPYPKTMEEALEFVEKYKNQARKINIQE